MTWMNWLTFLALLATTIGLGCLGAWFLARVEDRRPDRVLWAFGLVIALAVGYSIGAAWVMSTIQGGG